MPRFRAQDPKKRVSALFTIVAAAAMSACASSFFKITPEEGTTRAAPKPAADQPAQKPADKPAEKPAEKKSEAKPPEKKPSVVAEKPPQPKTEERKKVEPAKQPDNKRVVTPPPVAPPVARRPEPVAEAPAIEPTPAGSDSAGIARLMHAAAVWDAVRLFHPAAIANSAAWDNATVRILTDIRTNDANQYIRAMRDWLLKLNDRYVTTLDDSSTESMHPAPVGTQEVTTQTQVVSTGTKKNRVVDTTVIVKWPDGVPLTDVKGWNDLERVLQNVGGTQQLVLDLRKTSPSGVRFEIQGAARDKQIDVASMLSSMTIAGPSVRHRTYAGWADERSPGLSSGKWVVDAPLVIVPGRSTMRPRRLVIMANEFTNMPPALMALVTSRQATLISDAPLSDALLVPVRSVSVGPGLKVDIRTGEIINADGTVGFQPDTMVAPSPINEDSTAVTRTAILVARGKLQVGTPATRGENARATIAISDNGGQAAWNAAHYPIMGARLLALFRMWGTLRAFHAYNDSRDENIDDALYRIIPKVEAATDAYSYASAMLDFASATNDGQATLQSPALEQYIGSASAPFAVRSIEGRAIVTQVAQNDAGRASGLAVGDEIVSADGYPMPAYVNEHRRYSAASNDWSRLRKTMEMVPRGTDGTATYRVRDASNRERNAEIVRSTENARAPLGSDRSAAPVARDLGAGIAYLDVVRATPGDASSWLQGITSSRAIIVDARGVSTATSDGRLPAALQAVLRRTVQSSNATIARHAMRMLSEPCPPPESKISGASCTTERRQYDETTAGDSSPKYNGRVVVLIDERTEGLMEQFALAMETSSNATFIGSPSAGAVGNVSAVRVPGFLTLTFSGSEVRRPDGGQLQRVGLTPQVEVKPTVKGIRAGADEVLDRAQAWLKEQLDPPPVRRRR